MIKPSRAHWIAVRSLRAIPVVAAQILPIRWDYSLGASCLCLQKFIRRASSAPIRKLSSMKSKARSPLQSEKKKKKKRYNNRGLIKDVRAVPDESFALASHSFFASIPSSGEYQFFCPLRALS